MLYPYRPVGLRIPYFILLVFLLYGTACGTFPKALKDFRKGDLDKAQAGFEKVAQDASWGPSAREHLERIKISRTDSTLLLLQSDAVLCNLQESMKHLSVKQTLKMKKYEVSRANLVHYLDDFHQHLYQKLATKGTIPELVALDANAQCWSEGMLDTIRNMIVNKTLEPSIQVYDTDEDEEWESTAPRLPALEDVSLQPGLSCVAYTYKKPWTLNYADATTIAQSYAAYVRPSSYDAFWTIRKNIWDHFQAFESYCDMDQFKINNPEVREVYDCWYDTARDTLCMSSLTPLLAWHRNNPHSALNIDVCNQILCLAAVAESLDFLNDAEQQQVDDVELIVELQEQLINCAVGFDSTELLEKVVYLADKYQHHRAVFDLAAASLTYFSMERQYGFARKALETLRPLYPDTAACETTFFFQTGKQEWFDNFARLLQQAETENLQPLPVAAWNTSDHDEYGLVSYDETNEVFFVRRPHQGGPAVVMTSRLRGEKWSKPEPVPILSISDDVVPLSISLEGRALLLRSEGKLWRSIRPKIGRSWQAPAEMDAPPRFAGNAWISPDDTLLLFDYYSSFTNALSYPGTDLGVAVLQADDTYAYQQSVGAQVNSLEYSEAQPGMALGGRLLFYTSDGDKALGETDMFTATLSRPADWSSLGEARNLGIPLNTLFAEEGLTYFSEYTGNAYFHRYDRCTKDKDIWEVKLAPGTFPPNAMRLAGLVLDEHGQPIGGGFMEFTPDYQLDVHARSISPKGTYTYTVADSTEVVRLFPEIPGYFSERDTTHFLKNVAKGEIIRDTFRLTSFDYIRRNFKLVNSTYYQGESRFDQPKHTYPELTRLAKIANRMGAELDLIGHTDNTGAEAGNTELSFDRARAVKLFLVEKCGMSPARITVHGFGSSRPICDNDTEAGRRCNRRVEVVFRMPE